LIRNDPGRHSADDVVDGAPGPIGLPILIVIAARESRLAQSGERRDLEVTRLLSSAGASAQPQPKRYR